tara:strand:- start:662 stop:1258 length:597 start_codon:yes stop_codon:yes gene_type:complete
MLELGVEGAAGRTGAEGSVAGEEGVHDDTEVPYVGFGHTSTHRSARLSSARLSGARLSSARLLWRNKRRIDATALGWLRGAGRESGERGESQLPVLCDRDVLRIDWCVCWQSAHELDEVPEHPARGNLLKRSLLCDAVVERCARLGAQWREGWRRTLTHPLLAQQQPTKLADVDEVTVESSVKITSGLLRDFFVPKCQ